VQFYDEIINTIIKTERADAYIIAFSHMIQRLAIDRLHLVGDIFDRGPGAEKIRTPYGLPFGGHPVGQPRHPVDGGGRRLRALIANAVRICAATITSTRGGRYASACAPDHLRLETYRTTRATASAQGTSAAYARTAADVAILSKIHNAIAVMQFKLEGQLIRRHPEYNVDYMMTFNRLNFETMTLLVDGKEYPMRETYFPTVDFEGPLRPDSRRAFGHREAQAGLFTNEKLQRHVRFLYSHGSMYKCYNSNLLIHGCIPMDKMRGTSPASTRRGLSFGKDPARLLRPDVEKRLYHEGAKRPRLYVVSGCCPFSPIFGSTG
jgi:fructose-1,6-bisphosphatase-3